MFPGQQIPVGQLNAEVYASIRFSKETVLLWHKLVNTRKLRPKIVMKSSAVVLPM